MEAKKQREQISKDKRKETLLKTKDIVERFRHNEELNNPGSTKKIYNLLLASSCGFSIGFIMEKAKFVNNYYDFLKHYNLNSGVLSFITSHLASRYSLNTILWLRSDISFFEYQRSPWTHPLNLEAITLGSFLTGISLKLSGTTPILNFVRMIQNQQNLFLSLSYIIGGISSTFCYSLFEEKIGNWKRNNETIRNRENTLDKKFEISFGKLAIFSSCFFTISLIGIEHFFPWWSLTGHVKSGPQFLKKILNFDFSIFSKVPLPPFLAGISTALIYFIWNYFSEKRELNLKNGILSLSSNLSFPFFENNYYLNRYRNEYSNIFFGIFIIFGAFFSKKFFPYHSNDYLYLENHSFEKLSSIFNFENFSSIFSFKNYSAIFNFFSEIQFSQSNSIFELSKNFIAGFLYFFGSQISDDISNFCSAAYFSSTFFISPFVIFSGIEFSKWIIDPLLFKVF